jgi:hypothetical protein
MAARMQLKLQKEAEFANTGATQPYTSIGKLKTTTHELCHAFSSHLQLCQGARANVDRCGM